MEAAFPVLRMRRLRRHDWTRRLVAEQSLSPADLIWPLFLIDGEQRREPIGSMPGVERLTIDQAVLAAEEAARLRIPAVALFPNTASERKTGDGREALNPSNLVCRAVRAIKHAVPGIGVLCDVALDPYTTHGHDGVLVEGYVANDETVEILARQAVFQAEAGCDIVAPSDMMDGRVAAIRAALDASGFEHTLIMAYAAKYASAFYGPFREAVGSAKALIGDKRNYQMDPANSDEALREVALDIAEGADMVMIKPGLPYLDVLCRVKDAFRVPVFAYQVSGEYSMLVAAADRAMLAHYGIGSREGHRRWRTVTPAALPDSTARRRIDPERSPRQVKGGQERASECARAGGAVVQALRHAGVPARAEAIRVQREPFESNGERVETFAEGTRFSKHRLWHVEIEFSDEIRGPLVIGDGRFLGLGIMAPVPGRS